jgi:hypothetical protein
LDKWLERVVGKPVELAEILFIRGVGRATGVRPYPGAHPDRGGARVCQPHGVDHMKYIDVGLSAANLMLLNAWIERRLSGQAFLDIRDEKARQWWDSLIRYRGHAKYVRGYLKREAARHRDATRLSTKPDEPRAG